MKLLGAIALLSLALGLACVSYDLDGRRFRCDGITNTCDPGFACSAEGYCGPIATSDGGPGDVVTNDGATGELCNNNVDDDGDRLTDCADTAECPTSTTCGTGCACPGGNGMPTEFACADGVDNDGDLKIDCNDTNCLQCMGALMCCPDGACRTSC
jgi:hypothetical protein